VDALTSWAARGQLVGGGAYRPTTAAEDPTRTGQRRPARKLPQRAALQGADLATDAQQLTVVIYQYKSRTHMELDNNTTARAVAGPRATPG
jgi:hypothetical protein